jgi:CRISPR system Cascade subunit CasE
MELYLSRIVLDLRSTLARRAIRDVYEAHRAVMSAFPDRPTGTPRSEMSVLWRSETEGSPIFLVQSGLPPDPAAWEELSTDVAVKEIGGLLDGAVIPGRILRFRIRGNPSRKIDTKSVNGVRRHGRRVPLRRDPDRIAWLSRRLAAAGATVVTVDGIPDVSVQGFGLFRGRRNNRTITVEAVDFSGRLVVDDPHSLRQAVVDGIGPGKAFGMGLLMLAP